MVGGVGGDFSYTQIDTSNQQLQTSYLINTNTDANPNRNLNLKWLISVISQSSC